MKKIILVTTLLVISLLGYSQKKVNVPGTKIWMTPPEGAIPGENFAGFEVGESAMIQIMDLDGGNFYSNTRNYKKENFEAKGVTVLDFQKLTIDGYPALYIHVEGVPTLRSHQLVFGDSTFSVSLTANYAPSDQQVGKALKTAIFNATYKKDQKVDPFAHSIFSLDDTKTKLKFNRYSGSMYFYLPKDAQETKKNTQFLLAISLPNDGVSPIKKTAEQAVLEVAKYGVVLTKVISNKAKKVNGYEAHEIVAAGRIEDKEGVHLVVTIVATKDSLVMLQGMQMAGAFDKKVFTELVNTIRFRK